MNLIRTSLLNAVAVGVRMLSMLVLNKILAVQIGPSGLSLVGQLQNIITATTVVAGAGFSNGITKYTAEFKSDKEQIRKIWVTAVSIGICISIILTFFLILFNQQISVNFFPKINEPYLIFWLASSVLFCSLNQFFISIMNGLGDIFLYMYSSIASSIITLSTIVILTYVWGLNGALVGFILSQTFACIATIALVRNRPWFKWTNFLGRVDRTVMGNLFKFSLAAIATSVIAPIAMIFVRSCIINATGTEASGHWEAVNRISNIYLAFISTPMAIYFLPKLSQAKCVNEITREVRNGLLIIIPVTFALAVSIYLFRFIIIQILFSSQFLPMEKLIPWQLVGDLVRACAWIFSTFLLSRAKIRKFLIAEMTVNFSFALFAPLFILKVGTQGACIAYAVSNFIYLVILSAFYYSAIACEGQKNGL